MSGYPGNLIVENEECFAVDSAHQMFTQTELSTINEIVKLGFLCKQIEHWVQRRHDEFLAQVTRTNTPQTGMNIEGETDDVGEEAFEVSKILGALARGCGEVMRDYRGKILEVESQFLDGKIINLGEFRLFFFEHSIVLPELHCLLFETDKELLNSCSLLDLLSQRKFSGNEKVRRLYERLFDLCWQSFLEILEPWLTKGKLLHFNKEAFFVKKTISGIRKRNKDSQRRMDWNNDYVLSHSLVPRDLISVKTAKNILFIGKMVRILTRQTEDSFVQRAVAFNTEELRSFEQFQFSHRVNELTVQVSGLFFDLLVRSQKLQNELKLVRDYHFLMQDEFYNLFIEECMDTFSQPISKGSEGAINNRSLQNTLMRLNNPRFEKDFRSLKFVLKSKGFQYDNFLDKRNLLLVGAVENKDLFLRFKGSKGHSEGFVQSFGKTEAKDHWSVNKQVSADSDDSIRPAVWALLPQELEKGFQTSFCFKFRKTQARALSETMANRTSSEDEIGSCFTLVVQALDEVKSSETSKAISNTHRMQQALFVNFSFKLMDQRSGFTAQNFESKLSITVKHKQEAHQIALNEIQLGQKGINFADQDLAFVKVVYARGCLQVFCSNEKLTDDAKAGLATQVQMVLTETLTLDAGRAYLGLMHSKGNDCFLVDLHEWSLQCFGSQNSRFVWSELSLSVDCKWPINILLTDRFYERCSVVFSLILSLKIGKAKLSDMHHFVSRLHNVKIDLKFFVFAYHLKQLLTSAIDGFLEYFYVDALQKGWTKLERELNEVNEFEQLVKSIESFVDSLMSETLITVPQTIARVNYLVELVDAVDGFCRNECFRRVDSLISLYSKVRREIERTVKGILTDLERLVYSNQCFGRLMARINFNEYYHRNDEWEDK